MNQPTGTMTGESVEQYAQRLLDQWNAETAYLSSSTQITGHSAYQELIRLGPAALPVLFRELERTHNGHLSRALSAITGADPVPPELRGRIRQIAETWLNRKSL